VEEPDSQDATAQPETVAAKVEIPQAAIASTHNAWYTWADVAIRHERLARLARNRGDLYDFRPGLVALTAAAFALDALYEVAKDLVPLSLPTRVGREWPRRWKNAVRELRGKPRERRGDHGRRVGERLKQGVSARKHAAGKLTSKWPRRIGRLFDERDLAVHFKEGPPQRLVPHPTVATHVDPMNVRWGADAATSAVDLVLEVLDAWATHPKDLVGGWAKDQAGGVRALVDLRSELGAS
jgi:hypothetical protein